MSATGTLPAEGIAAPPRRAGRGVSTVYIWELEKLTAQVRVRAALALCVLGPVIGTALLKSQSATPSDTLFGRWVHFSGLAVPLVVLAFVTQYALPLLTCLVAGDIFAAEDHHGTWKMLLTRSRGRAAVFWGKALAAGTFCVTVVLLLALSSTAAGLLIVGHQPLVSLSGALVPAGHAAGLVLLSWASVLPPALAYTAMGLLFSIATRNTPAGILGPAVVGALMQLYSFVGGISVVRLFLLSTPFEAWHGLFASPPYHAALVHGAITSTVYLAGCLAAGYLLLRRRDFTQG